MTDALHADQEQCRRCGCTYAVWVAPSPLWNAVMRGGSIDGPWEYGELICPTCFIVLAEERGIACDWRVDAKTVKVELETVTPSGRIWNGTLNLWVEPDASEQFAENANSPLHARALVMAREIAADTVGATGALHDAYIMGAFDDGDHVRGILTAIIGTTQRAEALFDEHLSVIRESFLALRDGAHLDPPPLRPIAHLKEPTS